MRNGIRDLSLALLDEGDTALRQLEAEVDNICQSGVEVCVSKIGFDPRDAPSFQRSADYDTVVYCSDTSAFTEVLALQKNCMRKGCQFLPVVFCAGQAVLGPIVKPGGPCWLCAQVRLAARMSAEQGTTLWKSFVLDNALTSADTTFFTPIARHVGNAVGFELFKLFAGHLPSELDAGIICQDTETMESYHESLMQYPLCPLCSQGSPERAAQILLEVVEGKRDRVSDADVLRRADVLMQAHTGLLSDYQDDTLIQLPLKVSQLTVASPVLSTSPVVMAFESGTLLDARMAVLREAIGQYTNSLPDVRMMLLAKRSELVRQGKDAIVAQQLAGWSGVSAFMEDTRCEWLPAFSFSRQRVCYVPAAAVYPTSYLNRRCVFERTSAGSGVHTSFGEMLATGLTSALAYEHIQEALQGRIAVAVIDPETLEDIDADLTFLLRSLRHFEYQYTLFEVLSASPLPLMLAVCTNGESVQQPCGIGYGLSSIHAARNALLQLIGKLQTLLYEKRGDLTEALGERVEQTHGLPYAFAARDGNVVGPGNKHHIDKDLFLPEFVPTFDFVSPLASTRSFQKTVVDVQHLEEYLYKQGRDILFVNTTTADIWNAGTMMSGTVLLTRSA